jgi:zinc transport system permease protein
MMSAIDAFLGALLPFAWLDYAFMKHALLAMLLLTPMFGLLGTMAVDNRMAFFSDALGHSAMTGIALGVLLGVRDPMISMLAFGVLAALLITRIKQGSSASADTVIGVFSSTAIALGLVILSRGGGFAKYANYLVGDVLSVSPGDLLMLLAALVVVLVIWAALFNPLLMASVNPSLAASRAIPARRAEYVFVTLVAAVVMLSIRWVGVLLINSLLILPAAAARNVARNAAGYARWSVLFAMASGVAGLIASYYWNTSAGAAVVLVAAIIYFVTLPLRRK